MRFSTIQEIGTHLSVMNKSKAYIPRRFSMGCALTLALGLSSVSSSAIADTIFWNTWQSLSAGTIVGDSGGASVTFAGPAFYFGADFTSWTPSTTYADGVVVQNGPVQANRILGLTGGSAQLNTVSFSRPITNPVMAIWSLGQSSQAAQFQFTNVVPVFVAGGPNNDIAPAQGGPGTSIVVSGSTVTGVEGSGTVQFQGTYSSISWINPTYEYWYGFNVGIPSAVPESSNLALLLVGLVGMPLALRLTARRHRADASQETPSK